MKNIWFSSPHAEQGDAQAQFNLGLTLYLQEFCAEAAGWFRKAAEQGLADAQSNLGWMYERGEGVPQDYAEAVKRYRLASEQAA